ncbi:hypothetical protein TNCV_869541 [Trichonephila clavipes]|nr:hypothetical protein TNCV_869541 [Trichonephila clavipes]
MEERGYGSPTYLHLPPASGENLRLDDYLEFPRATQIVTSVLAESDPVDDETDEDEDNNNESSKGPSKFSVLQTAMEWCEQQSECCTTQRLLLKRI